MNTFEPRDACTWDSLPLFISLCPSFEFCYAYMCILVKVCRNFDYVLWGYALWCILISKCTQTDTHTHRNGRAMLWTSRFSNQLKCKQTKNEISNAANVNWAITYSISFFWDEFNGVIHILFVLGCRIFQANIGETD